MLYLSFIESFIKYFVIFIKYFKIKQLDFSFMSFIHNFLNKLK